MNNQSPPIEDPTRGFTYKGWILFDAIDALMAWDDGATDSGIHDSDMREAVRIHLASLDPKSLRKTIALFARRYFDDENIEAGSGIEDVLEFAEWLADLEIYV